MAKEKKKELNPSEICWSCKHWNGNRKAITDSCNCCNEESEYFEKEVSTHCQCEKWEKL